MLLLRSPLDDGGIGVDAPSRQPFRARARFGAPAFRHFGSRNDRRDLWRASSLFRKDSAFDESPQSNIIPFESFAAHRIQPLVPPAPPAAERRPAEARKAPATKSEPRRRSVPQQQDDLQPGLDFLMPPPQGPRTLKTQVEAVIYCDATVASPKHRAIASALDGGMIFIGFGAFLFTFHLMGGMFHLNRQTIPFFIGVFGTLALFYSMLWIWSGRETLGMRWTKLRLDRFRWPSGRQA